MSKRAHISLTKKLASTLLARGEVPYEDAKAMGEENFISLYQFHHNIRHADGGPDHFSNLEPMLIPVHRKQTAEVDAPAMAKDRKIAAAQEQHHIRMQAKAAGRPIEEQPRSARKMQSRPFAKAHRPIQGNGKWKQI